MRGYEFTEMHILCNKYHMILISEACFFSLITGEDGKNDTLTQLDKNTHIFVPTEKYPFVTTYLLRKKSGKDYLRKFNV